MTRRPTLIAVAAAVLLLPGLLTACSSGSGSGSDDSPTTGAVPTPASQRAGEVGSCMRDKGYDFDDSALTGGDFTLAAPEGVDPQQYAQDLGTCSGNPDTGGVDVSNVPPGPEDLAFAKCIRDNGFDDYPDGAQARRGYHPSDESAFSRVETSCFTEAYGDDNEPKKTGPQ